MADDRYEQAIDVIAERLKLRLTERALAGSFGRLRLEYPKVSDEVWAEAVGRLRREVRNDLKQTAPGFLAAADYLRRSEAAS